MINDEGKKMNSSGFVSRWHERWRGLVINSVENKAVTPTKDMLLVDCNFVSELHHLSLTYPTAQVKVPR